MGPPLLLIGLLLPLSLDTFALGAALGLAGLERQDWLRTSLILATFETVMPIVGVLAGAGVGRAVGEFAGYIGVAVLAVSGLLLLRPGDSEEWQAQRLKLLAKARGVAIVDSGISISVDELAIGFSLGLLGVSLIIALVWLALQAFAAAQLGIRIGNRVGEALREGAERLAALVLIAMAGLLLVLKLTSV